MLFKRLINVVQYSFSKKFTKKELKKIKPKIQYNEVFGDEIYFDHKNSRQNGGIQAVVKHIVREEEIAFNPRGIATVIYNAGLMDISEPIMFQKIDPILFKFEDEFNTRCAFGGLYGAMRTNAASEYTLQFFQSQVVRQLGLLDLEDCVSLYQAASCNVNFPPYRCLNFLDLFIQPHFLKIAAKQKFAHKYALQRILVQSLINLKAFSNKHQPLWEMLLASFTKIDHIKNPQFYQLHYSKQFYRSLENEVNYFKRQIVKRVDILWRYNVEEQRYYNYQELKDKREDYKYVADENAPWEQQQWLSMRNKEHLEILKEYREELAIEQGAIIKEQEIQEIQKEVDELIKNKYERKRQNKGNLTGLDEEEIKDLYYSEDEESDNEKMKSGNEESDNDNYEDDAQEGTSSSEDQNQESSSEDDHYQQVNNKKNNNKYKK